MTQLEKLDFVLQSFPNSSHFTNGATHREILTLLNKKKAFDDPTQIADDELNIILMKLIKDGFVNSEKKLPRKIEGPLITEKHYSITFEGVIFAKEGAYANALSQKNRLLEIESGNRENARHTLYLTLTIAFGTLAAAIYYLIEILKLFGLCSVCNKP